MEMVVGLLGILKAGAAYVPMDPAYPARAHRLDAGGHRGTGGADAGAAARITAADECQACWRWMRWRTRAIGSAPAHRATGENLAYVIFTSGSTGRPKGVQIEHRNVANFMGGMDRALGTKPGVWLALTSISFDISVLEIFWTLARGFTVVVQEEAEGAKRAAQSEDAARARSASACSISRRMPARAATSYRLLLEGAKFADTHDFEAVWTPERHFHPFGGLYPNPSVTSAAVAAITIAHRHPCRQRGAAAAQPDPLRRGMVGGGQPVQRPRGPVLRLRLACQRLRHRAGQFQGSPRADGARHRDRARAVARRIGGRHQRRWQGDPGAGCIRRPCSASRACG